MVFYFVRSTQCTCMFHFFSRYEDDSKMEEMRSPSKDVYEGPDYDYSPPIVMPRAGKASSRVYEDAKSDPGVYERASTKEGCSTFAVHVHQHQKFDGFVCVRVFEK